METPEAFARFPKFLMADGGGEDAPRMFVIHCHWPRFIMEFDLATGEGKPLFIDPESDYIANELANGREPAISLARLLREAGEFFMSQ